ncbi:MAG: chorismate mutase [Candidatus Pacebacteria bacterium]|nr:chorismate mutase [Candidatus Paceibacterota bacterium]
MKSNLTFFRKKIDGINSRIFYLISERIKIARKIAKIKKELGLKITDKRREYEVMIKIGNIAKNKKINPKLSKKVFKDIIELTKKEMRKIS